MPNNYYKIGKHNGTEKALAVRYKTYILDVDIYFFVPMVDNDKAERFLHFYLTDYRVKWRDGGQSEWFNCDIDIIEKAIDMINLVGNYDYIGYHNYKELGIKDHHLIGLPITSLVESEIYSDLGFLEKDVNIQLDNIQKEIDILRYKCNENKRGKEYVDGVKK